MPPENWCGKSSTRDSGFGIPTWRSSSTARVFACRLSIFSCARIASVICSPMRYTGFSDVIGSWKIIPISLPRYSCISVSETCEQVPALVEHLAAEARVHVARQPHAASSR